MNIPDQFIEELKDRIVLSELVGRRTRLKKQGRGWCGLSPFTNEKTPSFYVYDDRKFYKCFSSGKSGDAISFLSETENLSFVEAVEKLAGMAGLELPRSTTGREPDRGLYDVLAEAESWFRDRLEAPEGQAARDYLTGRGLGDDSRKRHGLGLAPPGWRNLIEALGRNRIDLLCTAGLAARPEAGGEPYDRFRNRLIFPIRDQRRRVIAFGGRALAASDSIKYINSPETPLFHKSHNLFRYAEARAACASGESMPILVEGYMDAIALADAGIESAMAPLGTALSTEQLALLWRAGPEPVICFDGDDAGRRAALAVAYMAIERVRPGYSLFFAALPAGCDPDDIVRRDGVEAMRARLRASQPLAEVIWQSECARHPSDIPERRAGLEQALKLLTGRIGDATVRAAYEKDIRSRLFAKDRGMRDVSRSRRTPVSGLAQLGPYRCSGSTLVARAIDTPELLAEVVEKLAEAEFDNRHTGSLRDVVLSLHESGRATDRAAVDAALRAAGQTQARALLAAASRRPLLNAVEMAEWRSAIEEYCVSGHLAKEAERTRGDFVRATDTGDQAREWDRRSRLTLEKRRSRTRANDPTST